MVYESRHDDYSYEPCRRSLDAFHLFRFVRRRRRRIDRFDGGLWMQCASWRQYDFMFFVLSFNIPLLLLLFLFNLNLKLHKLSFVGMCFVLHFFHSKSRAIQKLHKCVGVEGTQHIGLSFSSLFFFLFLFSESQPFLIATSRIPHHSFRR